MKTQNHRNVNYSKNPELITENMEINFLCNKKTIAYVLEMNIRPFPVWDDLFI